MYYLHHCSICVWAVYSAGGEFVLSCLTVFVCVRVLERIRPRLIIECVRVCLCVVSPFSCSLSLYVLVWCGAATVISGLLRRSSGSAPD